jgi:predicted nucleic acid-binding protein
LPDALIAASAKRIGARLISLNKKGYPMKDVEVQVPYTKKAK